MEHLSNLREIDKISQRMIGEKHKELDQIKNSSGEFVI